MAVLGCALIGSAVRADLPIGLARSRPVNHSARFTAIGAWCGYTARRWRARPVRSLGERIQACQPSAEAYSRTPLARALPGVRTWLVDAGTARSTASLARARPECSSEGTGSGRGRAPRGPESGARTRGEAVSRPTARDRGRRVCRGDSPTGLAGARSRARRRAGARLRWCCSEASPGVGKSTLALQLAAALGAARPGSCTSPGEESPEQVRLRADRLPAASRVDLLRAGRDAASRRLAAPWRDPRDPALVRRRLDPDSCATDRVGIGAGFRRSGARDVPRCWRPRPRRPSGAALCAGRVTSRKKARLAGPRVLEHLVDVVLNFEGDRGQAFRLLRSSKEPFRVDRGSGRVQHGGRPDLEGVVDNPSELLLAERQAVGPSGSCIVPIVEGSRAPCWSSSRPWWRPPATARRDARAIGDGRRPSRAAARRTRSAEWRRHARRERRLRERRRWRRAGSL